MDKPRLRPIRTGRAFKTLFDRPVALRRLTFIKTELRALIFE